MLDRSGDQRLIASLQCTLVVCLLSIGCAPPSVQAPASTALPAQSRVDRSSSDRLPVVLFDSYHAHNFLDRGLIPDETNYHRINGLRRARQLLTDRQVEVRELLIGPITAETLKEVNLVVLNLPSMDRPPWLVPEIEAIDQFIRRGGGMVFITDHSNCYYHQFHLLPLWQRLGLVPSFETTCERQPDCLLSSNGNGWLLIRKFAPHPVTAGVHYLAMQTGGRVVGDGTVAWSSPQAWADLGSTPMYGEGHVGLYGDMQLTDNEDQGAQGVVLAQAIDRGRVVVISDQNAIGDTLISYSDNWRLWLNACRWAGQLPIDVNPIRDSQLRLSTNSPLADSALPSFDQLIAGEPDRNSLPGLPAGAWQIECWEPLSQGKFIWGGNDPEQLYSLWCWLNRWCWASAHEEPAHPAPAGREMLWATDQELKELKLRLRIEQVLVAGGKVIIMPQSELLATRAEHEAWCQQCLSQCLTPQQQSQCQLSEAWQAQPVGHWQFDLGSKDKDSSSENAKSHAKESSLVIIPAALTLRNSQFPPPELAPSIQQAKWQRQFYHWLFEQP